MNLVEHYIKEIHGIKEYPRDPKYIIVDVTYDCYGVVERKEHFTTKDEWEKEKTNGYFLAQESKNEHPISRPKQRFNQSYRSKKWSDL